MVTTTNSSITSTPTMNNETDIRGIRNIWAVGRNYADHAKELGHQAPSASGEPMIFLKAGSSIVPSGEEFKLPSFSSDVHHECEVALQFGSNLEFSGLTISLDLTARDIQNKLKAQAHPWTLAKSFKASCALGPIVAIEKASKARLDLNDLEFKLTVGGELRQHGHTRDMIHDIEKLRRYVVERFPVVPGDLLLTGTPVGVAALKPGDEIHAEILNLVKAHWRVARN